jgi:hypothetical protein
VIAVGKSDWRTHVRIGFGGFVTKVVGARAPNMNTFVNASFVDPKTAKKQ